MNNVISPEQSTEEACREEKYGEQDGGTMRILP